MDSLLLRSLIVFAWVFVATGIAIVAGPQPRPWIVVVSLAMAGIATTLLVAERLRVYRLVRWTITPTNGNAPRGPGPIGELGYRVERTLRARDDNIASERRRLTQFLSAIEALPHGLMLLDEEDHIQWLNPTSAEHFGLNAECDCRQRVTNLVRAPAFVAYLQSPTLEHGVTFSSPTGDATLAVIVRRYGDAMKLVLSQDITTLERNDRMRRDLVANVSHEIRSPLTVLAGFVETLAALPLTEAERSRVLLLMRQQTDRMLNLVSDLLVLAQIEGAPMPQADSWVSVDALMRHLESDARASDDGRHELTFATGKPAELNGSEAELFSAFWNLIGNALRYTPSGGAVNVAWEARGEGVGEFRVRDTGPGIAQEHLPRLTERFYRVDRSRSRETGGTGLGLAIVKHVVQRHGGELQVESTVGKGSVFRILLPARRVRVACKEPVVVSG